MGGRTQRCSIFSLPDWIETTKLTTENYESRGMKPFAYEDKLELLGLLAGGFVILAAVGTMLELPWTTNEETAAVIVQMIGVFLSIAVGLILIQFTYSGDLRDSLPGASNEKTE